MPGLKPSTTFYEVQRFNAKIFPGGLSVFLSRRYCRGKITSLCPSNQPASQPDFPPFFSHTATAIIVVACTLLTNNIFNVSLGFFP